MIRLIGLIFLLAACAPPGGPIFTDDPPEPYHAPLELQCIEYADQHPESLLLSAALENEKSTIFPRLLKQIAPKDKWIHRNISMANQERFTLFMPTDDAWNAFLQQYPEFHLSGDSLRSLITQHVALAFIPYKLLTDGLPRASAGNGRIINFTFDPNGCILLNEDAHLTVAEDQCKNGMIHLIDQVIVPEHLK